MRKKKEGVLRKDVDTKVPSLMAKYDPQGNGTLSMAEFLQLQRDVIDTSTLDPAVEIHNIRSKVLEQEHTLEAMHKVVDERLGAIEQYIAAISSHACGGAGAGAAAAGSRKGSGGAGFSPAAPRALAPLAHSPGIGGSGILPPSTARPHE